MLRRTPWAAGSFDPELFRSEIGPSHPVIWLGVEKRRQDHQVKTQNVDRQKPVFRPKSRNVGRQKRLYQVITENVGRQKRCYRVGRLFVKETTLILRVRRDRVVGALRSQPVTAWRCVAQKRHPAVIGRLWSTWNGWKPGTSVPSLGCDGDVFVHPTSLISSSPLVAQRAWGRNPPSAEDLSSASTPPRVAVTNHTLASTRTLPPGEDLSSLPTPAPGPPGDVL